jgi:D-glycero-alpha-D-manno-heptose-7-phosphate kinase
MSGERRRRSRRTITSRAPIRICDNGGWTDTWFAEYGAVFHIAVAPCVEVQIDAWRWQGEGARVTLHAENYGDQYAVDVGAAAWGRHPLLEAAIARLGVPEALAVEIGVYSEAPAGASTGTSAAVTVALLGALDRLAGSRRTPHELATEAHAVEVEMLGQQSGIQDQLCAAHGGINYLEMERYPQATVTSLVVPEAIRWELGRRLALVYLGRAHHSSAVHEAVIRGLADAGPGCTRLNDLRATAAHSRDALLAGDFGALGQAMRDNTAAQGRLHPALVSADAQRVIEIARAHGALGWKVNGAGGEGGSVTLLGGPRSDALRAMVREIEAESPRFQAIPVRLCRAGVRVGVVRGDEARDARG